MKEKYVYFLFFIFIGVYIGYLQIINNDNVFYFLYIICFFILLINSSRCIMSSLNVFSVGVFIWLIYMLLSIYRTYSIDSGVKYCIVIIMFAISGIVLAGLSGWADIFYISLVLTLVGHVFYTIFSIFFTKEALIISSHFLSSEVQKMTERWAYEMHHYAGISGQTVINALFFVVLLGIVFAELLIQKKRYVKIELFFVSILLGVLLILTGKKASIIVALMCIVVTSFYYFLATSFPKRIVKIYYVLGMIGMLFLIMGFFFINEDIFKSFIGTSIISRERILQDLNTFFWRSPLWGNGVDSITFYVGHSAHNNYIQLLCEYGIIGFVLFLFIQLIITLDILKRGYRYMQQNMLNNSGKRALLFFCFYQFYFMVTGLFESTLFNYRMYLLYILSIASCYSIFNFYNKRKDLNEKNSV